MHIHDTDSNFIYMDILTHLVTESLNPATNFKNLILSCFDLLYQNIGISIGIEPK